MKTFILTICLTFLGICQTLSMPPEHNLVENAMDDDNETTVEDENMHPGMVMENMMEGTMMEDSMNETDDDGGWEPVGELVDAEAQDEDVDEEVLEDVSDPAVLSEDMCPEVLDLLYSMPEGLKKSLDELKQDHPVGNRPCFRSRNFNFFDRPRRILCRGPFYVVYRRFRYCCADSDRRHPLVERFRNRIRCRC
ncbi:hypothetical protein SK128_001934 [Halocaridina rubra]|uniref:Uncharacterized protein n=1 Tax=Halocaridina rubra TaxID=373956 RepID=A0AAN8XB64_HALRR